MNIVHKTFVLLAPVLSITLMAGQTSESDRSASIHQGLDRALSRVEQEFVSAAQAMPAEKYSFAPTGGEFRGVRNAAEQVKHVAAANYVIGSGVLGEKPPIDTNHEQGPEAMKSKEEVLAFLAASFKYLHQAIGSIDDATLMQPVKSPFGDGTTVTRLALVTHCIAHISDHYGQMVEYLRMNGIVPPASRPR